MVRGRGRGRGAAPTPRGSDWQLARLGPRPRGGLRGLLRARIATGPCGILWAVVVVAASRRRLLDVGRPRRYLEGLPHGSSSTPRGSRAFTHACVRPIAVCGPTAAVVVWCVPHAAGTPPCRPPPQNIVAENVNATSLGLKAEVSQPAGRFSALPGLDNTRAWGRAPCTSLPVRGPCGKGPWEVPGGGDGARLIGHCGLLGCWDQRQPEGLTMRPCWVHGAAWGAVGWGGGGVGQVGAGMRREGAQTSCHARAASTRQVNVRQGSAAPAPTYQGRPWAYPRPPTPPPAACPPTTEKPPPPTPVPPMRHAGQRRLCGFQRQQQHGARQQRRQCLLGHRRSAHAGTGSLVQPGGRGADQRRSRQVRARCHERGGGGMLVRPGSEARRPCLVPGLPVPLPPPIHCYSVVHITRTTMHAFTSLGGVAVGLRRHQQGRCLGAWGPPSAAR